MFKINKSKVFLVIILLGLAILGSTSASAQTSTSTTTTSLETMISQLMEQIKELETKIAELKSQVKAVAEELKIERTLRTGISGDDVKKLQEFLGQYPEFYPEGLITGYFGSLTQKAIKRLQFKYELEADGVLGPRTICTLKAVFENKTGKSGKTPPGLLIAPGILKKIDCEIKPLAGQILPPGIIFKLSTSTPIVCYDNNNNNNEDGDEDDDKDNDRKSNKKENKGKKLKRRCYFAPPTTTSTPPIATSTDTTAPVISNVSMTNIASSTATVNWTTNESATSKVYYSTSTPIDFGTALTVSATSLATSHFLNLSGLTASSTYQFAVESKDASNNTATSSQQSFITLE